MFRRYIKIRFFGHSPERFLNLCRQKQIAIWDLESNSDTYSCCMHAKDFKKMKALARKTKVKLKIIEKHGLSFFLFRYRKRRLFFLGMLLAFCVVIFLSRFIWDIEIRGNQRISDDVIYDYLKDKKVYHGMMKTKLDCENICKEIRLDFNEITWVSASLNGTSLIIDVREGKQAVKEEEIVEGQYDIIAQTDGMITSIVTRKGAAKVKRGDSVKAGDVLVSGLLEIKNDAGEVIREEVTRADADIWIERRISYEDLCENNYQKKKYYKTKKYRIFLGVNAYHLEFGLRKQDGLHERKMMYYSVILGKNFCLPLQLAIETSREYEYENRVYPVEAQKKILEERYQFYCEELEAKGVQILREELSFEESDSYIRLSGQLEVLQQIVDFY